MFPLSVFQIDLAVAFTSRIHMLNSDSNNNVNPKQEQQTTNRLFRPNAKTNYNINNLPIPEPAAPKLKKKQWIQNEE